MNPPLAEITLHLCLTALFVIAVFSILAIPVGRILGDRQRKEDELHALILEDQGDVNGRNLP